MFDEPIRLEDRLFELIEEWQSYIDAYGRHANWLLGSFWPFGTDAANADLGAGAELLTHVAQLVTMRGFLDSLLGVLEAHDESRATQYANHPQPTPGSDSGEA